MNIIFDLDGTLIDSSERMYQLFQKLVQESDLTKEEYWNLKRNKVSHHMILEKYFPQYNYDMFNKNWLNLIEQNEYLDMDCNYTDTNEVLSQLSKFHNLILLTARQSKNGLYRELNRLGLIHFFSVILVTEAKIPKDKMLYYLEIDRTKGDLFVSDMGEDIVIGQKYGYRTVAMTHGFMNRDIILKYNPDIILDSLTELAQRYGEY